MLERSVAEAGATPALEFFGRRTTYTELGEQVDRAAEGLRRLGVRAGDRVALILPNCPQHVVAFYAVLRLGAVVVEHNPLYTSRELRHQFEDHQARVVIAWDKAVAAVRDVPVRHRDRPRRVGQPPRGVPGGQAPRPAAAGAEPARDPRGRSQRPAPGTIPWEDLLDHGRIAPATRAPRWTTSRRSSTRPGPPAAPRARCSPTSTSTPTPSRARRGCTAPSTARRSSTRSCRCSTPSA